MVQAQFHPGSMVRPGHQSGSAAVADVELIERIASADNQAMSALVGRYSVRIYRFVLRMVDDRILAEDIVSDVFFEAWQQAHKFEARSKVSTWLLAIARNKALSAIRGRRVHQNLDEALDVADPSENAEAAWQRANRNSNLRDCLMKLSPNHREVLDLIYYHEQPIESVAKIVGIPLNTVKTRVFHARKHLATLLNEAGITHAAV